MKTVRRRYMALQVDSIETFSSSELMTAIWGAVLKLYGECGASQTDLSLITYDPHDRIAVVRLGHTAVESVRASLASITSIAGRAATVHVLRLSGTIKALKKKAKL